MYRPLNPTLSNSPNDLSGHFGSGRLAAASDTS
jgi:hypothetical protein